MACSRFSQISSIASILLPIDFHPPSIRFRHLRIGLFIVFCPAPAFLAIGFFLSPTMAYLTRPWFSLVSNMVSIFHPIDFHPLFIRFRLLPIEFSLVSVRYPPFLRLASTFLHQCRLACNWFLLVSGMVLIAHPIDFELPSISLHLLRIKFPMTSIDTVRSFDWILPLSANVSLTHN